MIVKHNSELRITALSSCFWEGHPERSTRLKMQHRTSDRPNESRILGTLEDKGWFCVGDHCSWRRELHNRAKSSELLCAFCSHSSIDLSIYHVIKGPDSCDPISASIPSSGHSKGQQMWAMTLVFSPLQVIWPLSHVFKCVLYNAEVNEAVCSDDTLFTKPGIQARFCPGL